ncbi:TPA: endopeptidase La [Candidatus Dependentiae bacterium]|nr:MAG: Lon protease [candidate division TM6 bacterium GW2011_GWF2_43_87]HBL98205.1 endopeptidase La [Candidatus Dependentiae bacterium]
MKVSETLVGNSVSKRLPVVPTTDIVVFPHMIIPLLVVDERIITGITAALEQDAKNVLLLASKKRDTHQDAIGTDDLYTTGTIASIMRLIKIPDGGVKILVQGVCKALVKNLNPENGLLQADVEIIETVMGEDPTELTAQIKNIKAISEQMASSGQSPTPDFHLILSKMHDPEKIADFILSHLTLSVEQAQALLEQKSFPHFLESLYGFLAKEIEVAEVQERIKSRTRDSMNLAQKEFYLREQMKAIRQELGDSDNEDIGQYRQKLEKISLSDESKQEVTRQINRLEKTASDSMEAAVIRNYLDFVFALPWNVWTEDILNIDHAKAILDEDHFGLKDIKDRILDFISVQVLNRTGNAPILCLAGPPGTGKTSLGHSIARSLGRSYFRVALGGIKDEAEIRGHRRTYVGAMPGRFIQGIRKAGSMNPVIIIDEIDKLGNDFRGDPSAALLELLDPQQNKSFYDNYLGIPFDLSSVLFIATANDLAPISEPLRDRMEVITLSGYSPEEKSEIARRHLIKKNCDETGLKEDQLSLSHEVLQDIVCNYTRESGVRELDRCIKKLCSKVARFLVEKNEHLSFSTENIETYLGPRRFIEDRLDKEDKIGITNGLAWTSGGGEMIRIEAISMPGNGKLILTGRLGEVMKESAQAALSYARAHAKEFEIDPKLFTECDLHIHVPAGGVPKDGPSAGITILSSILSALTKRPINSEYAMTGEIDLQGDVMAIGGIKEKILAAKRNKIQHLLLPLKNKRDLIGLEDVAEGIDITWVNHADEVLTRVLMSKFA